MTVELAQHRARLWREVGRLTRPTRQAINRDSGSVEWISVPPLWTQAVDALARSAIGGAASGPSPSSQRSALDLDLLDTCNRIAEYTRSELKRWQQTPRDTVPAQLRQLASCAVRFEPGHLRHYADTIGGWAATLDAYLHASEHTTTATRLRDSACPSCGARQGVADTPDGPVVAPVLLVEVRDNMVRGATCTECGATWWGGDGLVELAGLLGCTPVA